MECSYRTYLRWLDNLVGCVNKDFFRHFSFTDWNRLIQERVPRPNESGMEYVLDKYQFCRPSPTPLTEWDAIPSLINGLAKWEHVAATATAPEGISGFLTRIRKLELLGVLARSDVAQNRQPCTITPHQDLTAIFKDLRWRDDGAVLGEIGKIFI